MQAHVAKKPLPWWRFGMVWLVLSGPAIVVVAGCITAVIAFRGADVALPEAPPAVAPAPPAEGPIRSGPKR